MNLAEASAAQKGYRPEDLVLQAPVIRLRKVLRAGEDFKQN